MAPASYLFTPTPSWTWLTLAGPDVQDFLHRLTTADVRNLEVGKGTAGCFLNPQGRIRASFTLWRYGQTDFAFELDAGRENRWKTELLAAVDQYTFAEKMTLTDVMGLECRWVLLEPGTEPSLGMQPPLDSLSTAANDDEIRLCHQGSRHFGRPWITVWAKPGRLEPWLSQVLSDAAPAAPELLETWRVDSLSPRADAEITETTIPLEAGMIEAISANKGCYPGQEVIEKIVSLGAPARRLALLEGSASSTAGIPVQGDPIHNAAEPPAEVGQVTSVAASGTRFHALGYLRKIHAKEGLEVRFGKNGTQGKVLRIAPYAEANPVS